MGHIVFLSVIVFVRVFVRRCGLGLVCPIVLKRLLVPARPDVVTQSYFQLVLTPKAYD